VERFDWEFTRYVLGYRREHRPRILESLPTFDGTIFVLKTPKEIAGFVRSGPLI
jgi:hypothetical protein